jgi:hypothetical protein
VILLPFLQKYKIKLVFRESKILKHTQSDRCESRHKEVTASPKGPYEKVGNNKKTRII